MQSSAVPHSHATLLDNEPEVFATVAMELSEAAEAARRSALDSYKVLDTSPEPAFDRIVQMAALLLDVPIALVSLIDAQRQWFKARYGLEAGETPRAIALCDHAIRGCGLLVVPDATRDSRFKNNPLVTGEAHLRFYAGAPLVTPDGFALGTLCAIDRAPRQLDARSAEILEALAAQVMHELEVRAALGDSYREVAEGRRTARTLQGESARLEALLNATGNAVITADADGQVASLNRAAELIFGLEPGEAIGWRTQCLLSTQISTADDAGSAATREDHGRRKDGTEFPIELSHASWTDAQGRAASGAILRDVTERHRAEAELRRRDETERTQEKLAALGRVAGGVAHEINNLLQPVIGLTEFELDNLPLDGTTEQKESRENLTVIIECGRQMREIVRKILMFARKDSPDLTEVDFPGVLQTAVSFVGHLLPAGVRVDDTGADYTLSGLTVINEIELIEMVTNLAVNAADAMNRRGELAIGLRRVTLVEAEAASLAIGCGDYFQVTVTDTGHGMDASTKARIFDPFFTTKPIGEGTGLGLSAVYGMLRNWGGAITVDSKIGHGSTFTLYVPITDALLEE